MTHVKRVVDARANQGRLLYHLACGHTLQETSPLRFTYAEGDQRDVRVGDKIPCQDELCPSHEQDKPTPEHPRFAEHWSRCFAGSLSRQGLAVAEMEADKALEAYRKRFP